MESIAHFFSLPVVYWSLMMVYVLTVVGIAAVILSENRNPVKSLAWVTVLFILPLLGVILYLFFGRSIKNKRMISRRNKRQLRGKQSYTSVDIRALPFSDETKQEIHLAHNLVEAFYYPDNNVTFFDNGTEKFAALENDIRAASHYILLQYYIIDDDAIGTKFKDLLIAKAREGVKIRIIYDHIGSIHTSNRFFAEMRKAGIEVHPFFRVTFKAFASHINWRNHRKLCVIDGNVGYIGGMNIADRYIDGGKFPLWRDLHARVTGPAVAALHYSFAVDWSFMGQPLIDDEVKPSTDGNGNVGIQIVTSGPTDKWASIATVFLRAIANAKRCVYIQTPYFLPTEALMRALQTAAQSRVDVRIMIPRKCDSTMLRFSSFSYIKECLQAGIKIYLYEAGMLHSKVLIVDDEFSTMGSTNFDFRSFEHNFEINALLYSPRVNAELKRQFQTDLKDSKRISLPAWHRRPFFQKLLESILRLLSPIL